MYELLLASPPNEGTASYGFARSDVITVPDYTILQVRSVPHGPPGSSMLRLMVVWGLTQQWPFVGYYYSTLE